MSRVICGIQTVLLLFAFTLPGRGEEVPPTITVGEFGTDEEMTPASLAMATLHDEWENPSRLAPPSSLAKNEGAAVGDVPLSEVIAPPPASEEQAILAAITQTVSGSETSGAGSFLTGKRLETISVRDAILRALQKNLTIYNASKQEDFAKAALLEAKAIFHPVLSVALNYQNYRTYERVMTVERWSKGTVPVGNVANLEGFPATPGYWLGMDLETIRASGLEGIMFNHPIPCGKRMRDIVASKDTEYDPLETMTGTLSIYQQLPWGNVLMLTSTTTYKHYYFRDLNYEVAESHYHRSWSNNLKGELLVPLPWTKDFGRNAYAETSIRTARLGKEKAAYEIKTVINSTLLAVDSAYWDLVRCVMDLRSTLENRKVLEAILSDTEKLIEAKRATEYGKYQLVAELASLQASEAEIWKGLAQNSNRLAEFLGMKAEEVLFLPLGYSESLSARRAIDLDQALEIALRTRPELHSGRIDVDMAKEWQKFYANQRRLDLKGGVSLSHLTNTSLFGYEFFEQAMWASIDNPDQKSQSYGLTVNYPLLQRAARADYRSAEIGRDQADLIQKAIRATVMKEVDNAVIALLGATERCRIAQENRDTAARAFSDARSLRGAGRMAEFELVAKSRTLLAADYQLNLARVERRKAEAQLLAAMGTLAEEYPTMTARGPFEIHRLSILASHRPFDFFPHDPAKKNAKAE